MIPLARDNSEFIRAQILHFLPEKIGQSIEQTVSWGGLEEIRLRLGQPVHLVYDRKEEFLKGMVIDQDLIHVSFQKICRYSPYALREEIREGFITLPGGHRAGLCGKVYYDAEDFRQIKDISSLNIRIARQVKGCCETFFPRLTRDGYFPDTMLISPPGGGKTTFLRDLILHISEGYGSFYGVNVSVVDERGEIGGYGPGGSSFFLGKRTDILSYCPKPEGMLLVLRAMGAAVIAADEIGSPEDVEAIRVIRNSGCGLLMTAHGRSREELLRRPVLGEYLMMEPFERYVVIKKEMGGNRMVSVCDEEGNLI